MYVCVDCGHVFDAEDITITGTRFGMTRRGLCCPECGGDVEKAHQCKKCGNYFSEDSLMCGLYCRECLEDAAASQMAEDFVLLDDVVDAFAEWLYEEQRGGVSW